MGVEKIYRELTPERNPGNGSNPGDLRRDARRRNTIPRRKRQSVDTTGDQNPFHETTDEAFSKQYDATERYTNPQPNAINRVQREYANTNQQPSYQPSRVPIVRKKIKHKPAKAKVMAARLKLSAINGWVIGWSITWYLSFQWWMGLISLAGLGMAVAVYERMPNISESDGVFSFAGGFILYATSKLIAAALSLFGINFDPTILFIAPSAILLLLGLLFLLTICAMYTAAGVKCLTGTHAGLKIFTFIIALISTITPLPLLFIWLTVVWTYPKW